MKTVMVIPVLLGLLLLAGCNTTTGFGYLKIRAAQKLEIPPDLEQVALNPKFVIPANISSATGETVNQLPVLAQVDSLKLEGGQGFYWLSIDGSPPRIYALLKAFWSSEGYALDMDEPVIGVMQTEWIYQEESDGIIDTGFWQKVFSQNPLSASQNRFRTRIEQDTELNLTRVYISHRGIRYSKSVDTGQQALKGVANHGGALAVSESELEVEMLSRLMIFLGLEKSRADEILDNIKLFGSRASLHTDAAQDENFILFHAVQRHSWNRLLHVLGRLDVTISWADADFGLTGNSVVFLETNHYPKLRQDAQPKTDTATGEKISADIVKKQFQLVLSKENHELTRISIQTLAGAAAQSPEAIEFLTLLHDHLE